ncbi:MAG: hypothetical protein A2538_02855 [Candidatus Magasanikbacteria bacterium RIFOXYD2_FULL_41_14]|uniref:Uncharacterized protein n=1 Tax=Candidatus Magasanikbacteria bacterium RIFOXYD2_FULL_41_14 TaxID=1798709 RepID=A0A1F6PCM8_9BACT|nr:MAG: hypothetical protein A2538_02855 [Candidatus Magasanikbacteria bacterium RIFOXYD2_FULL_41_14]
MFKRNLAQIQSTKNDAYVSDAVMIFADEKNIFEGTILEKCSHDIDVIMINLKAGEAIKQHKHITSEEIVLVLSGFGQILQASEITEVKKDH